MIPPQTLRRNLVVLAMDFHTSLGWLYSQPLGEIERLMEIHADMAKEVKHGI